jgi:hypothetical protein
VSERTVVLDLEGKHELARDLQAGGVFVPGYELPLNEECELVLRGTDDHELRLPARVVWSQNGGVGLQLHNFDGALKAKLVALFAPSSTSSPVVQAPLPSSGAPTPPEDVPHAAAPAEDDVTEEASRAPNMHERLRGLTLAQQVKVAGHGELAERILLERIYGKNVWEPLLRNPRVTGPEVARIARMGSLPRPLMEVILNNGAWLQIPEVRRALLTNPRLGTDQILRIIRLLPKHEIKMAAVQTAYPLAVRDAAKRILKDLGS